MGLTQVNTSYYLGQSYHMGRSIFENSEDESSVREIRVFELPLLTELSKEWVRVSETEGKSECSELVKPVSYVSLINLMCSLFLASGSFFLNKYGFSYKLDQYLEIRTKQISVRVSNLSYRTSINSEIILTFFFPYEKISITLPFCSETVKKNMKTVAGKNSYYHCKS